MQRNILNIFFKNSVLEESKNSIEYQLLPSEDQSSEGVTNFFEQPQSLPVPPRQPLQNQVREGVNWIDYRHIAERASDNAKKIQTNLAGFFVRRGINFEDCLEPEECQPLLDGKRFAGRPFVLTEKRDNEKEEKDRQLGEQLWLDCQTKQAQLSKTERYGRNGYSEAFAELVRAKKQYQCWRTHNLIDLLEEFKVLPQDLIEPSLKKFEKMLPEEFLGLLEKYKLLTEDLRFEAEVQPSFKRK